ncbi:Flp family type IVb pilin [Aeromicrobium duanguangcaii]|uniref:Flp family type IVb pilin n=1 Tax=Aeromicrobium duanguangcaii TaxID=2968086 RepID=UPI002017C77D|nr:Flp family type IVb pilin [Aeromicrobium duanguangcaii]MCL3838779.1 Flp family type IVb pilin [Aeromicrobium duanguangcaii]
MLHIFSFLNAFAGKREEKGATATEYALIIAVIAVAIFGAMAAFGPALTALWDEAIASMGG